MLKRVLASVRESRPVAFARRTRDCIKGMAAIEFALIVPILLTFWLGTNEFGQALMIDRRVTLTASSVADLVAQNAIMTEAQVDGVLGFSDTLMSPALMSLYNTNQFEISVINVTKDSNDNLSVVWARDKNGNGGQTSTKYPVGPITAADIAPNFDPAVVQQNSFQIITKAEYNYVPVIGRIINNHFGGAIKLTETFFLAPRQGRVDLTP